MKVKCIDAGFVSLTFGKEYDVTKVSGDGKHYYVVGDDNEDFAYPARSFSLQPEVNLPPVDNTTREAIEKQFALYCGVSTGNKITYKDFLASMPESSGACVMMFGDNSSIVNVYGLEFDCPTEERAEEVYAALLVLFKEE